MSSESTRRDFLRLSGMGLAAVAATKASAETPSARLASPKAGEASVWVTDGNQRLARGSSVKWHAPAESAASDRVVLNPSQRYQEILGFGAAFTDASCYVLSQLTPADREKLFHELFHPSEMGLNVCRTCIGSSDYSAKPYSFDEGDPDPELKRFSIDHDREYILPVLREARKVNPHLFLFSTPWSPPGWMKSNNSLLGGNMRRQYMPAYANYFLKFLQGYESEGVPVQAITIQNEVDTDQDGRMPACTWPQEYEADFVRQHIGPLFEKSGVKTKIWIIDHNYNLWGRAAAELETPGVRKYTNAIAWHGYVGEPDWVQRVHQLYPDVEMYWTEGGPNYTDPNYATDWTNWSSMYTRVLHNWCRALTGWNIALDEQGRPNIGPFTCGGMVTINSHSKDVSYSGQYWAFSHYSRFVRRGAHRVESQSSANDLAHCSFENPDGGGVLVLTNSGAARSCQVQLGEKTASLSLTANSITTLTWAG
jgi:glucosylceramidase